MHHIPSASGERTCLTWQEIAHNPPTKSHVGDEQFYAEIILVCSSARLQAWLVSTRLCHSAAWAVREAA